MQNKNAQVSRCLIIASKIKVLPKTNLHLMDNHPMRLNDGEH